MNNGATPIERGAIPNYPSFIIHYSLINYSLFISAVFSSDKNIETIGQLLSELHRYAELRAELFKINAVSKLSKLFTVLLLGAILILLMGLALWFVSMMLAATLGEWLGSQALGYAIIVAIYLLLALTVYLRRKQWIEAPLTHFLGELFLTDRPSSGEGPTPSSQRFR